MLLLQSFVGLLAISQLMFMGMSYLVHYHSHLLARLIALYCVCLIAYIILSMPEISYLDSSAVHLVRAFAAGTPAVLWLITRHVFSDDTRISWMVVALFFVYIIMFVTGAGWVQQITQGNSLAASLLIFSDTYSYDSNNATGSQLRRIIPLMIYVPYIIMLLLATHSVYLAFAGADADLVEPRRQLRLPFVVAMGVVVILIVMSGIFSISSVPMRIGFYLYIFSCTLFFNIMIFRLHSGVDQLIQATPDNIVSGNPQSVNDDIYLQRIFKALETNQLYAQSHLTIGKLALKIGSREYLLRRFINQNMKYRNFNQFLNEYRIRKVATRLSDPHETESSVANIALDAGFASLSVFNRVFKEIYQLTPTVYRNQFRHS